MKAQKQSKKREVVVVGAGIVGASIAYHLSGRNDISVIVLERDKPGFGASGHSFAWLNAFGKDPVSYHHFNRRSIDIWDRFARRLDSDLGLHWGGELHLKSTDVGAEALQKRVKQLQTWGYPIRLISIDEVRELEPGLSPGRVTAASYAEIDGHVLPVKVVEACLKRVRERGGVVHEQTSVTGISLDREGRVEAVQTPHGEMRCDIAVLASGVDTTALAAMTGVDIPQEESPGVVIRTNPRPRILQTVSALHAPPTDDNQQGIHLRQSVDGVFQIGQGTQESGNRDDSQAHADDLLRRARHYLPALSDANAITVPVGYRPMPIDGLPVIGFTQAVPNLYIALMHSGVTLAPLVGELAVQEIGEGARVEMLKLYRAERFRR